MNRDSVNWRGAMPAVITPFDERGEIDRDAFCENVERQFDAGASGILVGGCTGEFWSLSFDERVTLFRLGREATGTRGVVLAGTGAITVDETLRLSDAAGEAGVDGALILPPYFIRLSDDEVFEHYRSVDRGISLPIVLYNIPGNALNALSPALAGRLADLDSVVAIKESSGDWNNFHATLIRVKDQIRVFCGPASIFGMEALHAGADGIIDCFPNVWLPGAYDLLRAVEGGHLEEARSLQATGRRLTELFTSNGRSLYPSTKAAMGILGYRAGRPRPPLQPLHDEQLDELRCGLRSLGVSRLSQAPSRVR